MDGLADNLERSLRRFRAFQEQILRTTEPMRAAAEVIANRQRIAHAAAESFSRTIAAHARAVAAFESSLAPFKKLVEFETQIPQRALRQLQAYQSLADRVSLASGVAQQLESVTGPIVEATRAVCAMSALPSEFLPRVDDAVKLSLPAVDRVNTLFCSPVAALPKDAEEPEEDASGYGNVAGHVHMGAESTVLAVNDVVSIVRTETKATVRDALGPYSHVLQRLESLASPRKFLDLLGDFAGTFAREHWKSMWAELGSQYHSRPEQISKAVLGMYLQGASFGAAFVGQELAAGPGFIDLLVNLLGKNHIVELKVIGGSAQGIGWAKSGIAQLDGYMESYGEDESFLVVFDGRKTDQGEQLKPMYSVERGVVHVVEVHVYFDTQ